MNVVKAMLLHSHRISEANRLKFVMQETQERTAIVVTLIKNAKAHTTPITS